MTTSPIVRPVAATAWPVRTETEETMSEDSASAFSLELPEDIQQVKEWVHEFAKDVIRPAGEEWDER